MYVDFRVMKSAQTLLDVQEKVSIFIFSIAFVMFTQKKTINGIKNEISIETAS